MIKAIKDCRLTGTRLTFWNSLSYRVFHTNREHDVRLQFSFVVRSFAMAVESNEIDYAEMRVFVRGYCVGQSLTHPYEYARIGPLWVMHDTPRGEIRVTIARRNGWHITSRPAKSIPWRDRILAVGSLFAQVRGVDESEDPLRVEYKRLGYRLLSTEPLFVHRLKRIPRAAAPVKIVQVTTEELPNSSGRQLDPADLARASHQRRGTVSPVRIAIDHEQIVGWVPRGFGRIDVVFQYGRAQISPSARNW